MFLLLAALQVGTPDQLPQVTLKEALRLGTRLEPGYVTALGQVRDAAWQRRAAYAAFVLPSITLQTSATRFSSEFFNIGAGRPTSRDVRLSVTASYDLFRGGGKFFELAQARAQLEQADAGVVEQRYRTALLIESDYYDVLAQQELTRVAEARVGRAEEQLGVARARVVSGAAVQTDSLQLLLELTRARVDLLRQRSGLTVAQLQLGRRIGAAGPVAAAPIDTTIAPPLTLTADQIVREALESGPTFRSALASARAAAAGVRSGWGLYLPRVSLIGQYQAFDERFFPSGTTFTSIGLGVSLPLWDNGQREISIARARTQRDIAYALRDDTERQVRRDAVEAFETYNTARASAQLADQGVTVARENLRVQEQRYRAGATTIIDLVTAQVSLTESEADVVQARYSARLALAGLEAILGRRLSTNAREQ